MGKFKVEAQNKRAGMQPDEIMTVMSQASTTGYTILKQTRVGFKGQIIEMIFTQPEK